MRQLNSNLAFIDMLFNLIVGFVSLFVIAFLLIQPPAEEGVVDPKTAVMITLEWDNSIDVDLDLWVLGPEGEAVSYSYQDNGYIVYERDDLGDSSDTFVVDGKQQKIERNMETTMVNGIVPGEYFVSIHHFGPADSTATEGTVTVYQMDPFRIVYQGSKTTTYFEEAPTISFVMLEDGRIVNESTSINKKIRVSRGSTGP